MPGAPTVATIRLYLKPAVRKFVAAKLGDLHRAAGDETALRLLHILEKRLQAKILHIDGRITPDDLPKAYLVVDVEVDPERLHSLTNPDRERSWHREHANQGVNQEFYDDMYRWVDWYRSVLGWNITRSLEQHRKHYSISEDDYPFKSCWRLYQLHASRTKQTRPYRKR